MWRRSRRPDLGPEELIVYRSDPRDGIERVCQVLAGMAFPAAKWQLVVQAQRRGVDPFGRAEVWALPTGWYADLQAVLDAMAAARSSEPLGGPAPLRGALPVGTAARVRPLR